MANVVKLNESTVVDNVSIKLKSFGLALDAQDIVRVAEVTVAATSDFLKMVKSKEKPVALVFNDLKGNLIVAAVVEYNEAVEDDAQGNWNYYWTFNADKLEGATQYLITDTQIHPIFQTRGFEMYRFRFISDSYIPQIGVAIMESIKECLDTNASETDEFVIEHEGFFKASVTVEDGEKVMSFLPDGEMKTLIKDDAATEV